MIPRAFITAWRATVPWADDAQVEQDLVLTRAVVEMFTHPAVAEKLVLRGGTAFYKLYSSRPARYSEDIDAVQSSPHPIGEVLDAIRECLDPWLGKPRRRLARDSVSLIYRFESETRPIRPLRLKIEINTREHFSVLDIQNRRLAVRNPWFNGEADVKVFHLDELFGTKLRALYQRKKGRDLFDLWLALDRNLVDPDAVVLCFRRYMEHGGTPVSRAQFESNLAAKVNDRSFLEDVKPLLASGIAYDPAAAYELVRTRLIARLPGSPWKGINESTEA